jgi:hypothetical protein
MTPSLVAELVSESEEEEDATPRLLGPRTVRDRETGQRWVETNRRKADMLARRGEVTHVLRQQGKRFFTRHKDGTMQMDPRRSSFGG